jgi:D-alanyl-D-alanine carboxypeptidase
MKEIRNIVAKKSYQLADQLSVKSTNQFYSTVSYNSSRYMIIGTKTGTTNAAGNVLVSSARDKQGHEIICAFFGNKSRNSTYEDTRKLLDYTFQCQDKKQISLKLSYYDIRYRDSESTIMKLCTKGILQIPESGEFHPADKVNQEYFVDTINKICSTNLKAIQEDTYITVKDFAAILYQNYPIAVSGEEIQKATKETINSLSQEKLPELAALYDTEILLDKYVNNINKCITKEDMIIIAVRLKEYLIN